MKEIAKYEAYKKKLQGVCDENELVFRFRHDKYPITLTIRPVSGVDHQMSLLENVEEKGYISPDAAIVFAYKDGDLTYKTSETFTISDTLFSKIKNLYKNMHSLWLQFFFREVIEKGVLKGSDLPSIDGEDESSESDDELDDDFINDMDPLESDDNDESGNTDDTEGDGSSDEGSEDGYEYDGSEADAEA